MTVSQEPKCEHREEIFVIKFSNKCHNDYGIDKNFFDIDYRDTSVSQYMI